MPQFSNRGFVSLWDLNETRPLWLSRRESPGTGPGVGNQGD